MSPPFSIKARTLLILKSAFAVAGVHAADVALVPPTLPPIKPTFSFAEITDTPSDSVKASNVFVLFIFLLFICLTI